MARWILVAILTLGVVAAAGAAEWVPVTGGSDPFEMEVIESSPDRILVEYRVAGFERTPVTIDDAAWFGIGLADEGSGQVAGLPALPTIDRSFVIADDAHMTARVVEAAFVDVPDMPVAPSRGPILRTVDPATVPYTFGSVYDGDEPYPTSPVTLGEPYILRDYRGLTVTATPYRYDPASRTLRVYTRLRIEVVADGPGTVNVIHRAAPPARVDSEFLGIYQNHFTNWSNLRYTPVGETGNMMIITHDAFHDAVQPLADWKNQRGIRCEIVDRSVAGATSAAIKTFIQQCYDTEGVTFVLLVGDAAQMPYPVALGGAADPTYILLAGNDNYPDAFVGRISAENVAQVETQVQRIIGYERDAMAGATWYHKGTGIASNQGPGDDGEYDNQHIDNIRADLLAYTYTFVDQIYDPSANATMVTNALNDGRSVINYCGHGSQTSWGSSGFSNTHVNNLVNDWMLPFIVAVACVNGDFVSGTCFAEAWLRATNGGVPTGAVATYMSSINQYWNEPMCAQDEVADLLVAGSKQSFGALCFNGSCQMMDEYGNSGVDMFKTWLVFGDPSVCVRTDTPTALTVSHPDVIEPDASSFSVTVPGVNGALCGLSLDGVYLGSAFTDAGGVAVIPVEGPLSNGQEITLTVSALNAIPYVTGLPVGQLLLPEIIVNPTSFAVQMDLGEIRTEYLTISNTGEPGSVLEFSIRNFGAGTTWLGISPMEGQVPEGSEMLVELEFHPTGMPAGSYATTLIISSNAGGPTLVPVNLGLDAPVGVEEGLVPSILVLEPNHPNPFSRSTSFAFQLPASQRVRLDVYDLAGRNVATPIDRTFAAGSHQEAWDARDHSGQRLAPGIYHYRLRTGAEESPTRRLIILQ